MQPGLPRKLEMRMKILIAIELIAGAVFVVWFWYRNPELLLSRFSSEWLLDPFEDEETDATNSSGSG
jgi:hypothetical protein